MNFKRKHLEIAVYLAPPILAAWWQKSAYYKHGFVVRLLWLGFVFRIVGRSKRAARRLIDQRYYDNLFDPVAEDFGLYDPEFWK